MTENNTTLQARKSSFLVAISSVTKLLTIVHILIMELKGKNSRRV